MDAWTETYVSFCVWENEHKASWPSNLIEAIICVSFPKWLDAPACLACPAHGRRLVQTGRAGKQPSANGSWSCTSAVVVLLDERKCVRYKLQIRGLVANMRWIQYALLPILCSLVICAQAGFPRLVQRDESWSFREWSYIAPFAKTDSGQINALKQVSSKQVSG